MKRKMKRKILAFLTAAAVGGTVLAGCSSGAEDSTSVRLEAESSSAGSSVSSNGLEVHIGDQPSFFILNIADKEGYFEDEFKNSGVKIVVDDFVNQGSAVVEAMNSGDVDLGIIGSMPLVTADANGSGFKAISSVNVSEDGFKLLTAPGLQVDGVSGLKGKKIAVKFSSNEHEMLLTLLKNAGLSETDVEILNMSADDCLNSLLAGEADAAVLKGDQVAQAENGGAVAIADNSETGKIVNYLVGRQEFLETHPEVVTGVLKVLEKTRQWINEHPDETVKIYAELMKTDETSARNNLEARDRAISIDPDKFQEPLTRTIQFLQGQGSIDQSLSLEDIIDTSYYQQSGVQENG